MPRFFAHFQDAFILVPPVRIKKNKKLFMSAETSMMHSILKFVKCEVPFLDFSRVLFQ